MSKTESSSTLRRELEHNIQNGRCAYCRRPAGPQQPLTREHVIPRARGGRRRDVRIIVPACARCNQRRGCQELVRFLLLRPRRISAFLDYLYSLSPESLQQVDRRVFGELFAAVWILSECSVLGAAWRVQLRRLCMRRTLHRRRYAARRAVGAVGGRLAQRRRARVARGEPVEAPAPEGVIASARMPLEEPLDQIQLRLLGLLSLIWQVSAEDAQRELTEQLHRDALAVGAVEVESEDDPAEGADDGVLPLDGWRRRSRRRRLRVDQRRGRGRSGGRVRGRAA